MTYWPDGMHEPLFLGISLPFIRFNPWTLRGTPLLVEMEGNVRTVLGSGEGDRWDILHKLLQVPGRLLGVLEGVAQGVLRMPGDGKISNVSSD